MWLWNDFSLCIDFPILFSRFWNIELDSLVSFEFFFLFSSFLNLLDICLRFLTQKFLTPKTYIFYRLANTHAF